MHFFLFISTIICNSLFFLLSLVRAERFVVLCDPAASLIGLATGGKALSHIFVLPLAMPPKIVNCLNVNRYNNLFYVLLKNICCTLTLSCSLHLSYSMRSRFMQVRNSLLDQNSEVVENFQSRATSLQV